MSSTRSLVFWIIIVIAFSLSFAVLREVLLPFVVGACLAYLLDPPATRLERLGINRLVATLAIVSIFILGLSTLIVLAGPIIIRELAYFIDSFPRYLNQLQSMATNPNRPWLSKIIGEGLGEAERSVTSLTTLATDWLVTFLHSAWSGGQELISIFSLLVVIPIVAIYLINDWKKMITVIDDCVPPAKRQTIRALAREIDDRIGGFVVGQGALCLILAVFYATALSLIGINHSVLIGIAAGVISFIPYLGSLTGLAISTCVAVAQFWPNWNIILLVPATFFVGQGLADYVLSPYFIGRRVNLNPVWVIFALFACGKLFGFIGLIVAVPFAAGVGVLVRFAVRQYFESPFYAGKPTESSNAIQN